MTAELMLVHGINNVRGAMFAECRDYGLDDISALTGFLGHYNSLDYKQLGARLEVELGKPRAQLRRQQQQRKHDECFVCGKLGHWSNECPEAWKGINKASNRCYRCGKDGHNANECSKG